MLFRSRFGDDSRKWGVIGHPDYAGYFKDDERSRVGSVAITSGGSGYTSAPAVTFSSSPYGTTATGTAIIGTDSGNAATYQKVTGVTITAAGSGYATDTPASPGPGPAVVTVTFTGGGGSGATGTVVVVEDYVKIAYNNFALYYQGGIGPFTGGHDALLSDSETCEIGDVLIDQGVAYAKSISDVITNVTRSTSANQKAVVGVFVVEDRKSVV